MSNDDFRELSCLEDAIELIPEQDKVELLEARKLAPQLVATESDFRRFLRFEKFDTWAAAKRVALYWRTRKKIFGDSWLLPMNQTGEGALSREDIALLNSGYMVLLPNDAHGRSVMCHNPSRGKRELHVSRFRVSFYISSVASENDKTQEDGIIVITIPESPSFDSITQDAVQMVNSALPLRFFSVHIVLSFDFRRTFKGVMLPLAMKFLGKYFLPSRTIQHIGRSKEDLLNELSKFGIKREGVPESIGGTWSYNKFDEWRDVRTRFEWQLPIAPNILKAAGVVGYKVKKLKDLTPEERVERKRRLNVLHSRRRRGRVRLEVDVLNDQIHCLRDHNKRLRDDNKRLEYLLSSARIILGLR